MATEYKLSYTAEEINEKLGQIGNDKAIVDVTELPTEGINEGAFYRLVTGTLVYNQYVQETYNIHCVEQLPEVGRPATNLDQTEGNVYYNLADGQAYGYVDNMLSMGLSVPAGWYEGNVLLGALGYSYSGAITHIDDDPCDDTFRILLKYEFYVYKDGWMEVPFGYEQAPAFDIQWDGEIGDRFSIDMSQLGYDAGIYFVKVSDEIWTESEIMGGDLIDFNFDYTYIHNGLIETNKLSPWNVDDTIDGTIVYSDSIIFIHSSNDTNTSLGLPDGYITNGIYFLLNTTPDYNLYVSRLYSPTRVTKIDEKFLPAMDVDLDNLATVATTGNYNDLLGKPTVYTDVVRYVSQSLSSSQKSRARTNIDVYSKSEVDTKIANAIGTAIGSGY